jgi:thiamine kinase-like enzyme
MMASMELIHQLLPKVNAFLQSEAAHSVPALKENHWTAQPLAQGEYNLNYLIAGGNEKRVLRINVDTQIDRQDQILYEYQALRLLEHSGVTPLPYHVDDSRTFFDTGILIMQYLPGRPLIYETDLEKAARLLATIHQVWVSPQNNHLIREEAPLSLIFTECVRLLATYFASDLADPQIRSYLSEVIQWADQARGRERFYQQDPWPCIVNTEVNSGNFIVNRSNGAIHLVDWEMPRWGDPSQDLSHFCSPLTTLWKTSYRMTVSDKAQFLAAYAAHIGDAHLRDTLAERIRLRDPFVYLRGISWSAMGWVAYQTAYQGVKNPDTWKTLQRYMNLALIRSLFDPILASWP